MARRVGAKFRWNDEYFVNGADKTTLVGPFASGFRNGLGYGFEVLVSDGLVDLTDQAGL